MKSPGWRWYRWPAVVVAVVVGGVGTAGPACADDPASNPEEMNGAVTAVEAGAPPAIWTFNSCGPRCAEVELADGRAGVALLHNGQWRLDELDTTTAVKCVADGSEKPGTAHFAWDAVTLTGQTWSTDDTGACGEASGTDSDGVPFSLTPVAN